MEGGLPSNWLWAVTGASPPQPARCPAALEMPMSPGPLSQRWATSARLRAALDWAPARARQRPAVPSHIPQPTPPGQEGVQAETVPHPRGRSSSPLWGGGGEWLGEFPNIPADPNRQWTCWALASLPCRSQPLSEKDVRLGALFPSTGQKPGLPDPREARWAGLGCPLPPLRLACG